MLIDARRRAARQVASVIPIGSLARYDRPAPAVDAYEADNPSAVSAISAITRVICAASARVALGRTSHNPPVVGSSPTRPTCDFTRSLGHYWSWSWISAIDAAVLTRSACLTNSPGASADAWEVRNLRSRRVIRMILISLGLSEASRNGQPFRSA